MKGVSSFALASAIVSVSSAAAQSLSLNTSASATDCCSALEAAGLRNVNYPGSDQYENRTEAYFSVSAQLEPNCIIQPTSAEEVSLAVTTLAQTTSCNWAIRSGGHTVWPGAANINNGVTIDLGLMNKTTYVAETSIAQIQAGSRWREAYRALDPFGVTVTGGRTSTVGVGGFLTGGGNTFYAARRGLGCDNVVNYEVVLASGEIVNANADENSDLFKALKGGSSNFGIVTRFDMEAFEAPDLWGGLVTYPTSQTNAHLAAYVDWTDNIENYQDGSSIVFWTYLPDNGEVVIIAAYEDTTGVEAAPAFDKFMAIPDEISNTMRKDSHMNLTVELELTSGYRNVWFSITVKNNYDMLKYAIDSHAQFVADWKAQSPDGDFVCHGILQSIPTIFSQHSVEKGGNVLGLDRESENAVLFQVQLMVNGVEQEELARERAVAFREDIKQFSIDNDAGVEWEYLNYADFTQDPLSTYGEENIALIREVATKYDPEGIFQTRMPGGFKISNVV